ncbi:MAG: hypothetical protein Q9217_005275 [Psora testacea]
MNGITPSTQLYDALIVGGGPAGLAAALAIARTKRTALVFDSSMYRNEGVTAMHTVPSRDGTDPIEFRRITKDQITNKYHNIHFLQKTIKKAARARVNAEEYNGFELRDNDDCLYKGRKLILATGSEDVLPKKPHGYRENWPEHIYQCLFCDGFEQSGHPIGILSFSTPAYLSLALMAFKFDPRVTIYSNGPVSTNPVVTNALATVFALGGKLDTRPIKRLVNNGEGPEKGITIEFEEGESVRLGMLLDKPPTINRAQKLFEDLGVEMNPQAQGGEVVVKGYFDMSSVEGCFVVGDTSQLLKQVTNAVAAGGRAAAGVSYQLCAEEGARALAQATSK